MTKEEEIKRQFRTIARLFAEIEAKVVARGRVNSAEFESDIERWKLNQTGIDYLAGLVRQSPVMVVQQEGDEAWLVAVPRDDGTVVKGMTPVWGEWKERGQRTS